MDVLILTLVMSAMGAAWLAMAWLDHKHGWQLVSWMNGRCINPFAGKQQTPRHPDDVNTIRTLEERIQVLEKLVTEPAYQLNKEILAATRENSTDNVNREHPGVPV